VIAADHTLVASLTLIAVNVGTPSELLDDRTGKSTLTGIVKQRVPPPTVQVDSLNIEGDRQADLRNHGGVDKAVYCYSHDHLPAWRDEIGYPDDSDAPFGENLSIRGAAEDDIHIGDRWQWGEVVLEVAQPRWPCFKLGLLSGLHDLPARLINNERSGWYFRVLEQGSASAADASLTLINRIDGAPTVRAAFQAARGLLPPDHAHRIATMPELAAAWRHTITTRYGNPPT